LDAYFAGAHFRTPRPTRGSCGSQLPLLTAKNRRLPSKPLKSKESLRRNFSFIIPFLADWFRLGSLPGHVLGQQSK
jgi:hypothetical protein